jgi:hypothetical protein
VEPLGDQLLDQLGTGRLVLNQHDVGIKEALLLADRTFQRRVFEALAQYV